MSRLAPYLCAGCARELGPSESQYVTATRSVVGRCCVQRFIFDGDRVLYSGTLVQNLDEA